MPRRVPTRVPIWGLGDQALSSATNFAVLVLVARSLAPEEVGVFALFAAGYATVAYVVESLVSEPLLVCYSARSSPEWQEGVRSACGCALALGLCTSAILLASWRLAPGPIGDLLLAGAVFAPGLLVQDVMRFAFFAASQPQKAFVNDLAWAIAQLVGVGVVLAMGHRSLGVLVSTWAGAGALAGALALIQARVAPKPSRALRWLRNHKDLWFFILPERLLGQGAMYLSLICIGAIAGFAAVGAIRVGMGIFGPLTIAASAGRLLVLPSLPRATRATKRRRVALMAALLAGAAALCGVVAIFLPSRIGFGLFGRTWPIVLPLLPFICIDRAASGAAEAWRIGLVGADGVRRALGARLVVSSVAVIAPAVGASVDGARGAVVAGAAAMPVAAVFFLHQFRAATRDVPRATQDEQAIDEAAVDALVLVDQVS